MSIQHTQVLIVGGSVAGLALANMLERAGIDYLVLEKYGKIGPDLGASIGIFPNGARILDQLGCYDQISALIEGSDPFKSMFTFNPEGKKISALDDASEHFTRRFGYSPVFVDRQTLIQILHENLRNQSKVLVNQGVVEVEQISGAVRVTTERGDKFSGEILIGADGIHSTIRREMWRIADEKSPGYFPKRDRTDVPCEYCCIFGISKGVQGFELSSGMIMGSNHSYLVCSGPEGRTYWFLFSKLPVKSYGSYDELPRFTEEDTLRLAQKHAQDRISDTLYFKDLFDSRTTATLTALPEFVFSKWHYGRILTIGDAAHKFNPIGGQGGMSAIETAAVLTNYLYPLMNPKLENPRVGDDEIAHVFRQTQAARHQRVESLKEGSHFLQSLHARDTLTTKLIARYIVPSTSADFILDEFRTKTEPAARLEIETIPLRPRFEPFNDERPAKPLSSKIPRLLTAVILAVLMKIALSTISLSIPSLKPADGLYGKAVDGTQEWLAETKLAGSFINAYYIAFLLPVFLIWNIEGHRAGTRGSLIALPSLYALLCWRNFGYFPVYYLASVWSTSSGAYIGHAGRAVPESVARAVAPAAILGYGIPAIVASLKPQLWLAVQCAPMVVSSFTFAISQFFKDENPVPSAFAVYSRRDMPYLTMTYKIVFGISAIYHILFYLAITYLTGSPPYRWIDLVWSEKAFVEFTLAVTSILIYSLYSIYELRHRGLIVTRHALDGAALYIIGQVFVGPGAAAVALWQWREGVMAAAGREVTIST